MAKFQRPATGQIRDIKFHTMIMCGAKQLNPGDSPFGIPTQRNLWTVLFDEGTRDVWLHYDGPNGGWAQVPWTEVRYVNWSLPAAPEPERPAA